MASFERGLDHWCLVCSKKSWASYYKCSQCICVPQNDVSVSPIEAEAEPTPPSSSAAVIEAAAPENPVTAVPECQIASASAGDQSEPSAVAADVQEAVSEAKLEAGAQSKLLPQYTNTEVHNALHAYGTHGINVQGAPEGTQRQMFQIIRFCGFRYVAACVMLCRTRIGVLLGRALAVLLLFVSRY